MLTVARLAWNRAGLMARRPDVLFWGCIVPVAVACRLTLAGDGADGGTSRVVVDTVHASEMLDALEVIEVQSSPS